MLRGVRSHLQCLPDSQAAQVTECDTSSPALWTDAPNLLTDGQVVDGLTPNTLYSCPIAPNR